MARTGMSRVSPTRRRRKRTARGRASRTLPDVRVVGRRRQRSSTAVVLAGRNEARHVAPLMEFYRSQGVDVVYLDDASVDGTLDMVLEFLGDPVVWVGRKPFEPVFDLAAILAIKQELMREMSYRWVVHSDMDEYRSGPAGSSLEVGLAAAASEGFNAVNFQEFAFIPVAEEPDHDHDRYRETMHWYYAHSPGFRSEVKAFMPGRLPGFDLVSGGGHRLRADGLEVADVDFTFEHYVFLSLDHHSSVYGPRVFAPGNVDRGWHNVIEAPPVLPRAAELSDRRVDGLTTDGLRSSHPWMAGELQLR